MVDDYRKAAQIVNDPNLTEEDRYNQLLAMEAGEFGQVPMTAEEQVLPDRWYADPVGGYGGAGPGPVNSSRMSGGIVADGEFGQVPMTAEEQVLPDRWYADPVAGYGGAGPGPVNSSRMSGGIVADVRDFIFPEPMQTAMGESYTQGAGAPSTYTPPIPPIEPIPPGLTSGGERMSLGEAQPSPSQGQLPSLSQLLALQGQPARTVRIGPQGFSPDSRLTEETVLPPLREFGPPVVIPIEYTGETKEVFDPSQPGARRTIDVGAEESFGNITSVIANQAGLTQDDALQRMMSPDGLIVEDPETGPVLYRSTPDGQISASFTQETDYTNRIQQKAQEFVIAQRENLIQQTELQKAQRESSETEAQAQAGLRSNFAEKITKQREKIAKAVEEIGTVDPQRYMKNESFGQALSRVVYMWAMGMAGGVEGFKYAVDDMDNLIQRDIQAQMQSIQGQKEYAQMLKEELPLIEGEYKTRQAQVQAVHAARLAKTIQAMRQARKTAAELEGRPYMEEEDYQLQQAIAELELRQAEALRQAALLDAKNVKTSEKYDTGVRTVGGTDPLKRIKDAADVLKTLKDVQGGNAQLSARNLVEDPVTGEVRVALSPRAAQDAEAIRKYGGTAISSTQRMAQLQRDYDAGKIDKATFNQQMSANQVAFTKSYMRMLSPEALSEGEQRIAESASPLQRANYMRRLPGGEVIGGIVSPNANPDDLEEATIDTIKNIMRIQQPKTYTVDEAKAMAAGGIKFRGE